MGSSAGPRSARIRQHVPADCQVLPQLSWLIGRFRAAGEPGWGAPSDREMEQHFGPGLLAERPGS